MWVLNARLRGDCVEDGSWRTCDFYLGKQEPTATEPSLSLHQMTEVAVDPALTLGSRPRPRRR